MDGFISVLKPPGMTSSDVVLAVRRRLPRGTRVGHGGTLDPDAAGVLPVCVGKATRLFDYLIDKRKEYYAELALGVTTDTQDASGRPLEMHAVTATGEDVEKILPNFAGWIQQIPPAYSAIKRDGKRLYELARKGETIEVQPRPVQIYALEYCGQTAPDRHMLRIECGKGTYIRTLLHDIGAQLGCGGHMAFLLRSRAGCFTLEDSVTMEELAEHEDLRTVLAPLDAPLGHLPAVRVDEQCLRAVLNGNKIPVSAAPLDTPLRVYCGGRFAGIGCAEEAGWVRFKAMLLSPEEEGQ